MVVESDNSFALTFSLNRIWILKTYVFKDIGISEDSEANIDQQFDTSHDRIQSNVVELEARVVFFFFKDHIGLYVL